MGMKLSETSRNLLRASQNKKNCGLLCLLKNSGVLVLVDRHLKSGVFCIPHGIWKVDSNVRPWKPWILGRRKHQLCFWVPCSNSTKRLQYTSLVKLNRFCGFIYTYVYIYTYIYIYTSLYPFTPRDSVIRPNPRHVKHISWGSVWLDPQKHTDQTPNLSRYLGV